MSTMMIVSGEDVRAAIGRGGFEVGWTVDYRGWVCTITRIHGPNRDRVVLSEPKPKDLKLFERQQANLRKGTSP